MADDSNHEQTDRRTFLKTTGLAAGAMALPGLATATTPGRTPGPKENELLVGIAASTSVADARSQVERELPGHANVVHENRDLGYMAVSVDEDVVTTMASVQSSIERANAVKYVERNETLTTMATPNDPRFSDQYAPQQVRAPSAWDTEMGDGVTIAVIDQGVAYDHPDLSAQFGSNRGYDFVDDDSDPYPEGLNDSDAGNRGIHGTHVAGICAATTDNGTGVAGISNATLLSGRALSNEGSGSTADIADAVQWAADQGADIINMSLGGGGYTNTMKNAVSYAVNNGALPICANGNAGNSSVDYPAAYDECVAVAASREGDEFVDDWTNAPGGSNYGPKTDVIAPGEQVLSTWPDTPRGVDYYTISGTSMATPAAAGVAALGLAADPELTPTQLRSRLKQTAVDIGEPADKQGSGRVDAKNIVDAAGGGGDDGGDDGGSCGDTSSGGSANGSLSGYWDSSSYTYTLSLDTPCQVTVSLSGPSGADFDLYVTTDGRTPSTNDYDKRSVTQDSQENVVLDTVSSGQELGILVDSYSGSGSFTLDVEELGN
ncbi:S8 family serine peptidase [Haloarchaeobius sp. DFWS5]|uniref:S8 family serine peptidase n=1 Tax=Haloarchaeobius sp. DFWS5 TaxID=3446114 RepID=UPI003EBC08C7